MAPFTHTHTSAPFEFIALLSVVSPLYSHHHHYPGKQSISRQLPLSTHTATSMCLSVCHLFRDHWHRSSVRRGALCASSRFFFFIIVFSFVFRSTFYIERALVPYPNFTLWRTPCRRRCRSRRQIAEWSPRKLEKTPIVMTVALMAVGMNVSARTLVLLICWFCLARVWLV